MKSFIKNTLKTAIISVYIIIIAGSVVRMTGSGMGCPDWPKCFGYYIPPTEVAQITWKPNTNFHKKAIIIFEEKLYYAKENLTTDAQFNYNKWAEYTKHDYAEFNPMHTWIEYINRLTTVLSGFIFIALIGGLVIQKVRFKADFTKHTLSLCLLALFGMGFEAWLGKTVVDSNLMPYKITIHMVGSLFIVAMLLRALFLIQKKEISTKNYDSLFHKMVWAMFGFIVLQMLLGTQVRQFVDEQVKLYGFHEKEYRLMNPSFKFYFHRSFTIAVVLLTAFMVWLNFKYDLKNKVVYILASFIFLEAFTGILMYYVDFPFGTQVIHLFSSAVLFGVLLNELFKQKELKKSN